MKIKILDYIDFNRFHILLEDFNKLTGFSTAILDLEGNILSKSGWRKICTNFHRINPKTNRNCIMSDTELANKKKDNNFNIYRCHNGLYDVAVPIIIEGEHVANLFTGQFFFEKPNISYFSKQAKKYGFDEQTYLKALNEVPIVTEIRIKEAVKYLLNILKMIIDLTIDKIKQENSKILLQSSFDRLDRSQKISNVGSWELDLNTNLIWGSQEAFNIYELPRDSEHIYFSENRGMILPKDIEITNNALVNLIKNEEPYDVHFTLNTKTKKKYIHAKATLIKDSLGNPSKVLGVIRDITEFNLINQKQKESEAEYRLLSNNMPFIVSHFKIIRNVEKKTTNFQILWVNKSAEQYLGMNNSELVGKNPWDLYKENQQIWIDAFEKVASLGEIVRFETYSNKFDKYIKITVYKTGIDKMACIIEDVTEAKKKQNEIIYISYHDSLTGLHNRRSYEDNLNKLDIQKNYPLTIVMSDINGLKLINDAFGHGIGDKLLISASKLISNSCRESDLVARIGGDEFVIAMPNTSGIEAEKIIDKINKEAKKITIESIELSISFGYETKNEINEDIHKIYRKAEDLMYQEKLLVIPSMRSGAIETILNTLNEKDKSSEIHSRIVSNISEKIALAYGMDRLKVNEVKTAGLLHDIGKIMIPIKILLKEGKLTTEEYNLIKTHPEIGFRILNSTHDMRSIANIVLSHHERWDGFGYPRKIKEEEIPIQSRIIAIADVFDAMTSVRTYRKICTNEEALAEIIRCSGTQFDPKLVQVFADNFDTIINI